MYASELQRVRRGPIYAFTLVELLVTCAVLGILASLLFPALTEAKRKAEKALCQSNMRQWGIAVRMYADDHNDYFVDNRDAFTIVDCGTNVQAFWAQYLLPWVKTRSEKERNNILFCPTDRFHRQADLRPGLSAERDRFSGYLLLPHRETDQARTKMDYRTAGVEDWHLRAKIGQEPVLAPVLVDKLMAWGKEGRSLRWVAGEVGKSVPMSNHVRGSGEPSGGNFLFEDGHVSWYVRARIDFASKSSLVPGYLFFYKVSPF